MINVAAGNGGVHYNTTPIWDQQLVLSTIRSMYCFKHSENLLPILGRSAWHGYSGSR